MLKTIPTWIWYVLAGAEYYEAAASLLPGGEGTG
jgi:hypothetical protein